MTGISRPQPLSVTRQPRQPRPRTSGESSESLKLFFFFDWRIQSLELAEQLLRSVAPVDVIVYGGDDVSRFVPDVEIPFKERVLSPDDTFEDDELGDLALAIADHLGCELPPDLPRIFLSPRVRDLLAQFPVPENWPASSRRTGTYAKGRTFGVADTRISSCQSIPGSAAPVSEREEACNEGLRKRWPEKEYSPVENTHGVGTSSCHRHCRYRLRITWLGLVTGTPAMVNGVAYFGDRHRTVHLPGTPLPCPGRTG